eukprot:4615003-Alexandrium_andersonii.AAC.1
MEHVDFRSFLNNRRMPELPGGLWPDAKALDGLMHLSRKARRPGQFVYVRVQEFLPIWASSQQRIRALKQSAAPEAAALANDRLTAEEWHAAYLRMAFAYDAAGLWKLSSSLAHLDCCMRIGRRCRDQGLPPFTYMVYDEIARPIWADNE